MAEQISYKDKISLQNDIEIPEESKVTDENMNEIKRVVNTNASELNKTTETTNQTKVNQQTQAKLINILVSEVNLLKSQIPIGQAEGKFINVKDSSNLPFKKFGIGGNDFQETREGSNVLNFNVSQDSKVIVNDDGTITINGSSNGFYLRFNESTFLANTKYYIRVELVSGSKTTPENSSIMTFGQNPVFMDFNKFYEVEFTENTTKNSLWVSAGQTFNNARLKIWANTDKSDFEQYGAMPSIYYPSDVRAVGDNINILNNTAITKTINGVDFTVYEDGTVLANGTATDVATLDIGTIECIANQNYTLGGCPLGGSDDTYKMYGIVVSTGAGLTNDYGQGGTFKTGSTVEGTMRIRIANGYTANNLVFKPKLEKGNKKTPWSPYGMGSIEVKKVNKNWLKLMNGEASSQGIASTVSDGTISCNGQPTSQWGNITPYNKNLIRAGKYIFSRNTNKYGLVLRGFREDGNYTDYRVPVGQLSNKITINNNIIQYYLYLENLSTTEQIIDLQIIPQLELELEEGEVATTPIPHESENYVVPTQEPFYEGDTFVKIDGVRYEKHLWEKYVFTGNETWVLNETGDKYIRYTTTLESIITDIDAYKKYIKSNKFFSSTSDETVNANADKDRVCVVSNSRVLIKLINSDYSTADLWETYLAEQYSRGKPLYVVYKLAEPKLIPCTEEQNTILDEIENSSTYKNVTYIYSNDEISPVFDIEYYKDLDTIINNTKKETQSQIDEIKELLSTTGTSAMLLENLKTDLESEV